MGSCRGFSNSGTAGEGGMGTPAGGRDIIESGSVASVVSAGDDCISYNIESPHPNWWRRPKHSVSRVRLYLDKICNPIPMHTSKTDPPDARFDGGIWHNHIPNIDASWTSDSAACPMAHPLWALSLDPNILQYD